MLISYKKVLGVTVVLGTLIGAASAAGAEAIIKIDGSSTMHPITEAVAKNFEMAQKGAVNVTVGISGTGGGFAKFCRGEIDIANASRPIQRKEMKACNKAGVEFVELPVAFDPITVAVNPENKWLRTITVAELRKMWEPAAQGKITRWSQVNPAWPDEPFKLYGAGADSGTYDYFTRAVIGKARSSRNDFTASEDDNVLVQGIANDKNALGFFGFGYYIENQDKIRAVAVANGRGEGIIPSAETVENGTYQPLSRPIFIYVNMKAAEKPEIKEFIEFYMKNASAVVREIQYIPLPPRAYTKNMEFFKTKRLGTVFDGFLPVGLTIDELLRRQRFQGMLDDDMGFGIDDPLRREARLHQN
ncbi:phosphate ABC transporter substrate-binding protein, PhoT family [Nitrosospira sp. Nl5]|uniref:PstS family phosphate ABC transporter substrate-binding protein n=1 Tax=Nitrosospira sp. Nl5 TaxID=200120 RepID=UPI00088B1519|nr:PstS family phosphate ABC transporter substrate-binding protein [Nitrosospira sp. Nl5]SCY09335.1 phosphate ABC transporter substrate-binding protein, PhoT family [Nitrosospira sp. Nl5]